MKELSVTRFIIETGFLATEETLLPVAGTTSTVVCLQVTLQVGGKTREGIDFWCRAHTPPNM
jgi:hypothetical protein